MMLSGKIVGIPPGTYQAAAGVDASRGLGALGLAIIALLAIGRALS
jgi:hypothetical protein